MSKQIYISLPVKDLDVSSKFYEALGFVKNSMFGDNVTFNSFKWSEDIIVMLLTHEAHKRLIGNKERMDAKKTAGILLALNFDSKEELDAFAKKAGENGGKVSQSEEEAEGMYSYDIEDPDGNGWGPFYIDTSAQSKM